MAGYKPYSLRALCAYMALSIFAYKPQVAFSEGDTQILGNVASGLGSALIVQGVMNLVNSSADCSTAGTGGGAATPGGGTSSPPPAPVGGVPQTQQTSAADKCPSTATNLGVIGGGLVVIAAAVLTADSSKGSDGGFNPFNQQNNNDNKPKEKKNNPFNNSSVCGDTGDCGCSLPTASSNPLCASDPAAKFKELTDDFRNLASSGSVPLPDGKTLDEILSELDSQLGTIEAAVKVANGEMSSADGLAALEGAGFGNFSKDGKSGSRSGEAGFEDSGFGSSSSSGGGSGSASVGPKDRSGLGKTLWNGLLDMLDETSGKSLTLWQRVTRKYQGDRGHRALAMARMELIRNKALRLASEREMALKKNSSKASSKVQKISSRPPTPPNTSKAAPQKSQTNKIKPSRKPAKATPSPSPKKSPKPSAPPRA